MPLTLDKRLNSVDCISRNVREVVRAVVIRRLEASVRRLNDLFGERRITFPGRKERTLVAHAGNRLIPVIDVGRLRRYCAGGARAAKLREDFLAAWRARRVLTCKQLKRFSVLTFRDAGSGMRWRRRRKPRPPPQPQSSASVAEAEKAEEIDMDIDIEVNIGKTTRGGPGRTGGKPAFRKPPVASWRLVRKDDLLFRFFSTLLTYVFVRCARMGRARLSEIRTAVCKELRQCSWLPACVVEAHNAKGTH